MNDIISHNHNSVVSLEKIEKLEGHFLEMPQSECPVIHRFGPGIYIREVTIPADTFSIGHYQKTEHMNVMLSGRVTMIGEDGQTYELKAPAIFTSKPGRKIGYIHEEMRWLNIYSTTETDVDKLEEMLLIKSITWKEHEKCMQKMLLTKIHDDKSDFLSAIAELGFSEEEVRNQSESEIDQIPFPAGSYKCKVSKSQIHGKGLFATSPIESGEIIAPARLNGKRTPAGRYTNHSASPNAKMFFSDNDDIYLVAISPISGCFGGSDGQEITIDYRVCVQQMLNKVEHK